MRSRPGFANLAEAETSAEQARTELANQGTIALALPMHVRVDAAKTDAILALHGVSIIEVAKY